MVSDEPLSPKPRGLVDLVQEGAKKTIAGLGAVGRGLEGAGTGLGRGLEGAGAGIGRGLEGASAGIGRGLEGASAALATPDSADLAPLLPAVDLPELPADGPLGALATRLDREADLCRGLALRELARVAWTTRITQTVVIVAAACEILIATAAAGVALVGGVGDGRAGLFLLAALIVAGGAGLVLAAAGRARASHTKLADDATLRARSLEERIFRVAIALEWRRAGEPLYQDALARLERDIAPAPPSAAAS